MDEIAEVKQEIRHREWMMQIQECQSSGLKVNEWCRANNIRPSTYYSRLKRIRMELITEQSEISDMPHPAIVPVNVAELKSQTATSSSEKIVIRKNGMEIEVPENISGNMIQMLLKGLSQC